MSAKLLKKGAPFLAFVVGAPLLLQQFNRIRYDYRSNHMMTNEEQLKVEEVEQAKMAGVAVDKSADIVLQQARDEAKQEWTNIRGPRPWEDSKEMQAQQKAADPH